MTPKDNDTPRPITASDQPVFPARCWSIGANRWFRVPTKIDYKMLGGAELFSYWTPQYDGDVPPPPSPTGRPDDNLESLLGKCPDSIPSSPDQPIPSWAVEAAAIIACDRYPDSQREEKRVARIIARHYENRHAPTPSAESDTAMLQWLEDGHNTLSWNDRAGGFIVQRCQQVVGNIGVGRTIRSALLAAMKGEQGEGK